VVLSAITLTLTLVQALGFNSLSVNYNSKIDDEARKM
jgi:hypothetical protein